MPWELSLIPLLIRNGVHKMNNVEALSAMESATSRDCSAEMI